MKDYIENTLAPRIQGDGSWVEFVALESGTLTLRFRGECSKCLILDRCCRWIEQKVAEDLGEAVTVVPQRSKPFFWDNN